MVNRYVVLVLRVLLVALFAILLVFQTLSIPGGIAYMAQQSPNDAPLRWPLTFIAAFLILCVQVVVVCTWRLLGLVARDRIFTEGALRWVDAIIGAIAAAWLVLVAIDVFVATQADDPGMPMVLLLVTTGVTVFGLLVIVLRALLHQATALRTDLEGVI